MACLFYNNVEGGLIFMAEKIVDEMAVHLEQGHPEHLSNVLYVNFHGLEVQEQCTELVSSGMDQERRQG
jgi:hypothetical protein